MKRAFLFLMLFLIIPSVLAGIEIKTDQPTYNLKNRIGVSASVLQDNNFEGLFKLTLKCDNYNLQYFLTPVNLEANFRTAIDVPQLTVTPSMLGKCSLSGELSTNDNSAIDQSSSESFTVTDKLTVLPVNSEVTASPGSEVEITGIANEAFGNNAPKGTAKITLDENSYETEIVAGKFDSALKIPGNIKSGKHAIAIDASDPNGNSGSSSVELEITAVPVYIKIDIANDEIVPGTKLSIKSSLYDQADDLINTSLGLELTAPGKKKVFTKIVQSNEPIDYEFSQYAEPGIYSLISVYSNLVTQQSINVTAVKDVKIKYTNQTVTVENIGNVPFEDELTFIIQDQLKKYSITKIINIEPGKILSIDLSKEVPSGIYDILLPLKEGIEPITDAVQNAVQESVESMLPEGEVKDAVLATSVQLHDNRPVYKKIATGFASISNAIVGADGLLTRNPVIAPSILFFILLLIVLRYGRKPIMSLFKRRKEEKKDEQKQDKD